jgi:hypothetical protein
LASGNSIQVAAYPVSPSAEQSCSNAVIFIASNDARLTGRCQPGTNPARGHTMPVLTQEQIPARSLRTGIHRPTGTGRACLSFCRTRLADASGTAAGSVPCSSCHPALLV